MSFVQPPYWAYERGGLRGWPQHVSVSLVTPPIGEPLTIAEALSQVRLNSASGEPLPSTAVTVALAGLGAGGCENGAHRVACSFVLSAGLETPPGPLSAPITVVDKTVNGQLAVTGIPAGSPAVTLVKLWMPPVGALAPLLFAGSVANGVTTATIGLADAGLGAGAPTLNTALDTSDLAKWIQAARMDTEVYTRCCWMPQSVDVRLSHFPFDRRAIDIPIRPLIAVTGIDYIDSSGVAQTMDPSLYDVDAPKPIGGVPESGRVLLKYGQFFWPFPPAMQVINGVTIHCDVGYGTKALTLAQQQAAVPATAKTAMQLLVGNWWQNREAGQIIRGSADILPYGVDRVLDPFKLERVA